MAYYTKTASFSDSVTTNSCNSLDTELSNIQTGFTTAEAAVGVHTAAIAANAANIATNTANIATNAADIVTLQADVDSTAIGNTLGLAKFVGYSYDATSAAASSAAWTACTITIPANTCANGIKVDFGAYFQNGASTNGFLPLRMKVGAAAAEDLSVVGTPDPRFHLYKGNGAGTDSQDLSSRTMWIDATTTSGLTTPFDKTKEIILYAGLAWNTTAAATIAYVSMAVTAV